jgi:uncharacterized BrkB/YihY/UPF0761 family membrane protein
MARVLTPVLGMAPGAIETFGRTYGQLGGIVALQLWSFFSAVAVLLGTAVAAQLEAVRDGDAHLQNAERVEDGDVPTAPAELVPAT